MRIKLTTLVLSLYLAFSGQPNYKKHHAPSTFVKSIDTSITPIDTSIIAILPYKNALIMGVFKNCKPARLTNNEMVLIERLLRDCINKYNSELEKSLKKDNRVDQEKYLLIDLKQYKRQYAVATNSSGEKEVWINCFCQDSGFKHDNWKKYPVSVDDGGNCYFNLKINLATGKYYNLMVNGFG